MMYRRYSSDPNMSLRGKMGGESPDPPHDPALAAPTNLVILADSGPTCQSQTFDQWNVTARGNWSDPVAGQPGVLNVHIKWYKNGALASDTTQAAGTKTSALGTGIITDSQVEFRIEVNWKFLDGRESEIASISRTFANPCP